MRVIAVFALIRNFISKCGISALINRVQKL